MGSLLGLDCEEYSFYSEYLDLGEIENHGCNSQRLLCLPTSSELLTKDTLLLVRDFQLIFLIGPESNFLMSHCSGSVSMAVSVSIVTSNDGPRPCFWDGFPWLPSTHGHLKAAGVAGLKILGRGHTASWKGLSTPSHQPVVY